MPPRVEFFKPREIVSVRSTGSTQAYLGREATNSETVYTQALTREKAKRAKRASPNSPLEQQESPSHSQTLLSTFNPAGWEVKVKVK